ncbi:MAG TPA: AAA domain-containing protein [Candidatus Dormibacteraeota bacterium]|nr:AAA domain-containing protein [Candidatus Dormibacteraeota bacterium]
MSFLRAFNGDGDGDPLSHFAAQIGALDDFPVVTADGSPPTVTLLLPGIDVGCTPMVPRRGARERMALKVVSLRPAPPDGDRADTRALRVRCRAPLVTADDGEVTDTVRLLDLAAVTRAATAAPILLQTLALVDGLENAERTRATTQRTPFKGVVEWWRCRTCRALWRPDQDERCRSCGRSFTPDDRHRPEIGKLELSVPADHPITLTVDAAVMIEPEDEAHYLGRVTRIDQRRRVVEVTCRAHEGTGTVGWIIPSFNRALYQAKRSTLAGIAAGEPASLLLAQLLLHPELIHAPQVDPRPDWLTSGMHSNLAQDRAIGIMTALESGQAALIQGPPGTGKTTVIVEAIKHRLLERPDDRILVCSHSNLAVDNALERLAGTPGLRAVRVAKAERVHPAVDAFRVEDEDDPRLADANVLFATCATAATSPVVAEERFDLVILDEANKARIDEALPCLRLGAALVLVGDHKQLPPVEDDAIYGIVDEVPDLEEIVDTSLFERCWDGGVPEAARCLLVEQHRMHPQISQYVSAASYDNHLQNAPEVLEYDFVTRRPFPVALHFVDTTGLRGGGERRGAGGALRNDAEVRVCAQVVRLLNERCDPSLSLAEIAMYADQVDRLRQALGRRHFRRSVRIDTVDSFEGREEDLVVISLVRSNERGRIGFLRVPNRLNVAISRARRLVVCVGNAATLRAGEETMYGRLAEAAREAGGYVLATELLGGRVAARGRRPRGRSAAGAPREATGDQEWSGGTGRPPRSRRRRRSGAAPAQVGDGLAGAAAGAPPTDGLTGPGPAGPAERTGRRRRRRRRPGVGPAAVPPQAGTGAAAGAAAGAPEAPSRRRRRRRGRRPGGPGAPPGAPGGGPPTGGGDTPGPTPA